MPIFRLSIALGLLALCGCGAGPETGTDVAREAGTKVAREARNEIGSEPASVISPRFRQLDPAALGLDFVLDSGARGEKLLPETMGGGLAFVDLDGDERPELLFVDTLGTPRLYRNRGDGTFDDVTATSGLGDGGPYGMGVAVADVDGDGLRDLFLTGVGPDRLLRARGDLRYEDVTERAGVGGGDRWSTGAAFGDFDGDGTLDLVVGRYVRWSREADLAQNFARADQGRAYRPPFSFPAEELALYRGLGVDASGAIRFEDATSALVTGATGPLEMKTLAVLPVDVDDDGDLDLFLANDTLPNHLLRNDSAPGRMRFEAFGAIAGVGYGPDGLDTGAMGVDFERVPDVRSDALLSIAVGNFAREPTSFFVARGGQPLFEDRAAARGIAGPTRDALTFGLLLVDLDLDGDADLFQANGHIEPDIARFDPGQRAAQPAQLLVQDESGRFTLDESLAANGLPVFRRGVIGRGAAAADLEGDGDLDLVATQIDGPPVVLRNETLSESPETADASSPSWLRLRLLDDRATSRNRDALGARVTVHSGGPNEAHSEPPKSPEKQTSQEQVVEPARSYLSSIDPTLTFGLGTHPRGVVLHRIEILWPDGERTVLEGDDLPPLDRLTVIARSQDGAP